MNFTKFMKCMGECCYAPGLSLPELNELLERTGMTTRVIEVDIKDGKYYAKNVYNIQDIDTSTAIRCLKSHLKHFRGLSASEVFLIFDSLLEDKTAWV